MAEGITDGQSPQTPSDESNVVNLFTPKSPEQPPDIIPGSIERVDMGDSDAPLAQLGGELIGAATKRSQKQILREADHIDELVEQAFGESEAQPASAEDNPSSYNEA